MVAIKEKTICFTGHRPEKLPGYGDPDNPSLSMIKSMLFYQICRAIDEGYRYFISGVSKGVDLWAARYVLKAQAEHPDISLICVKPFEQHGQSFKGEELFEFNNIIACADEVICLSDRYTRDCYKKRNCFMVDHSSRVIAVVGDYRSGTGQTISYARKQGLEINIIKVQDYLSGTPGD